MERLLKTLLMPLREPISSSASSTCRSMAETSCETTRTNACAQTSNMFSRWSKRDEQNNTQSSKPEVDKPINVQIMAISGSKMIARVDSVWFSQRKSFSVELVSAIQPICISTIFHITTILSGLPPVSKSSNNINATWNSTWNSADMQIGFIPNSNSTENLNL